MHALCFSSSVSSFACVFFVASSCVCLFVSIAIAPNSIVFLEKKMIFFCSTPPLVHLLTCLLLFFAIDFRLRLFSWWRAFDCSRFLLAAGCRRAVWFFRFSDFGGVRALLLVAFPRSAGWTMHEWRVVPCSNLDEVLPGSPEPGGKFFLSFFLRACCK